jgi:hypothetical protein
MSSKKASDNPELCPIVSDYYKDLTTLQNADYPPSV